MPPPAIPNRNRHLPRRSAPREENSLTEPPVRCDGVEQSPCTSWHPEGKPQQHRSPCSSTPNKQSPPTDERGSVSKQDPGSGHKHWKQSFSMLSPKSPSTPRRYPDEIRSVVSARPASIKPGHHEHDGRVLRYRRVQFEVPGRSPPQDPPTRWAGGRTRRICSHSVGSTTTSLSTNEDLNCSAIPNTDVGDSEDPNPTRIAPNPRGDLPHTRPPSPRPTTEIQPKDGRPSLSTRPKALTSRFRGNRGVSATCRGGAVWRGPSSPTGGSFPWSL